MSLRDLRPEGIDPLAPGERGEIRSRFLADKPSPHVTGINIMNAIKVAQRYFDAWNRNDADAIVAAFAEGGT
jgi:hypothetical protein